MSENSNMSYSDELFHHGRLGQKHGERNGPPYPLDYSRLSPEEKRLAKDKAIREGNVREAIKNPMEFTDQELTQLKNRFNLNEEVRKLATKDVKSGKQRIRELSDTLDLVATVSTNGIRLYNNVAKVVNGLNESADLPVIGGGEKKKENKKKK